MYLIFICSNEVGWDKTSNIHRTELIENSLMVDLIKGCAEINQQDPSLLHTIQCTLQCMVHAQQFITGTQAFPIRKLGGWKHTTAFHKSSETNWHQTLIEEDDGPFGIVVTLACLPRRSSHRNTTLRWGQNISFLRKKKKHTQWASASIRVQIKQETPDLATRPEGKGGRPMASEW